MSVHDDPPVSLVDRDYGDETPLFNVQQNMATRRTDPYVDAVYSRPSEDTFIVSLDREGQFQINGRASAFRIAGHPDYDDDPMTALAEFAARLLAHINGNQGVGWTVVNEFTDREIDCVAEQIDVIKRRSEKFEFDYSLTLRAGSSMMPPKRLDPEVPDPSGDPRLAGRDLHEIEEMMVTKSQQVKVHTYATPRPVEANEIEALSGAQRQITIRGNIPGDESVRREFDEGIREYVGTNQETWFESHFPGDNLRVVVTEHDASREAGQTQIGQYNTTMIEGTVGTHGEFDPV